MDGIHTAYSLFQALHSVSTLGEKKEQPLNKSWNYAKLHKAFYSLQMVMHLI